jgi:starch phosphorylase
MHPLKPFINKTRIAYFSLEIALRNEIPTYAGGLGVLAGDTLYTAADLELPLVGVTLISRRGFFRQEIDAQGRQREYPEQWTPETWLQPLDAKIAVPLCGRDVWVQAWLYVMAGDSGRTVPVILLDTDLTENAPEDREITHELYGRDEEYRLKQEAVLGIGGARMLQALGFHPHTYHMNEGHSALLALELLRRYELSQDNAGPGGSVYDVSEVRERCLFTTHTPIDAGHDQFSYELVKRVLDEFIELRDLRLLDGEDSLNMTLLALRLSGYVNGVGKAHAETSRSMYPGYRVHAVSNGVYPGRWTHAAFQALFDRHIRDWRHEPSLLLRADQIAGEEVWSAHLQAKQDLIGKVLERTGVRLDPAVPVIGFSRRMTAYKRPDLLFNDLERLRAIARRHPFQIVLAGKAHPLDTPGKGLIEDLHRWLGELAGDIPSAFLPNYDMQLGLHMVSGSDIWLNTPLRPLEASGTSGMKAALNGVPSLSVLDGWWIEGCIEGVTGWSIGSRATPDANGMDADSLYDKLEHTVLPLYYADREGWLAVMKNAIAKNGSTFNSFRMMRRYASEAYIR